MSDEESFVILGSCSPGNSLNNDISLRSGFQSLEQSKIENKPEDKSLQATNLNDKNSLVEGNLENITPTNSFNGDQQNGDSIVPIVAVQNVQNDTVADNAVENNEIHEQISMTRSAGSGTHCSNSNCSDCQRNGSLAASFIMGEINADVLKTSVYSQFPSLCSMEACAEDVVKLQNFMSEYIDLKATLAKVNATMRQFYSKTQKWHEDMQRTEQIYKQRLDECQIQIAKLRNENLELKSEMSSKLEQIRISDVAQKQEVAQMIANLSEKSALIDNLREQIARLDQQQLASFEYIPKNTNDTKENPDYIARTEHLHAMKELERKMSALLAENLELKDMQNIYMDEINCLKVNLTAAEELLQQSRKDVELLKANDEEKSQRFTEYESERNKMREDIEILRQQVDVYSKDFQMERTARENLVGEKDQLLQDLRVMQRNNQQLVEELQKYVDSAMRSASASTAANVSSNAGGDNAASAQVSPRFIAKPLTAKTFAANMHQRPIRPLPQPSPSNNVISHECPICREGFNSLARLQSHVNTCLDNAEAGR